MIRRSVNASPRIPRRAFPLSIGLKSTHPSMAITLQLQAILVQPKLFALQGSPRTESGSKLSLAARSSPVPANLLGKPATNQHPEETLPSGSCRWQHPADRASHYAFRRSSFNYRCDPNSSNFTQGFPGQYKPSCPEIHARCVPSSRPANQTSETEAL